MNANSLIRVLSATPRARLLLSSAALVALFVGACKKDDENEEEIPDPPTLEFLGAQNSSGLWFDPNASEIELNCDSIVTLSVGPRATFDGSILSWNIRPPGTCGAYEWCGYLDVRVLDADGNSIHRVEQASAYPILNLSKLNLDEIAGFSARLIDGDDGRPFLVDGLEVTARWEVGVNSDGCPTAPGSGGMGGMGGMGGEPQVPEGGAGGIGGSTTDE